MKKGKFIFSAALICALSVFVTAQAAPSSYVCRSFLWHRPFLRVVMPKVTAAPQATPATTRAPQSTPAPTAAPTAAPKATSAPKTAAASSQERAMLALVNADRAANGLNALVWDDALAAGARAQSRDMAEQGYFSHTSPTYGGFAERFRAAGFTTGGGENIAHYGSIEKAEAAFLSSEGHRANLLSKTYKRVGIGIVESGGAYYITQWFAQ